MHVMRLVVADTTLFQTLRIRSTHMDGSDADLAAMLAFIDANADGVSPTEGSEGDQYQLPVAPELPAVFLQLSVAQEPPKTPNHKSHNGKRSTKRSRPANYNSNRARSEQRRELPELRDQVQELEQTLAALHSARIDFSESSSKKCKSSDGSASGGAGSKQEQVWKELAARQLEQRTTSETERRRLHRGVDIQQKVISRLQQLAFCKAMGKVRRLDFMLLMVGLR